MARSKKATTKKAAKKRARMVVRFFDDDDDETKSTVLRRKLTTKNGEGVSMRRRDQKGKVVRDHKLSGDRGKPPKKPPVDPTPRKPKKKNTAKARRAQADALKRAQDEIEAADP